VQKTEDYRQKPKLILTLRAFGLITPPAPKSLPRDSREFLLCGAGVNCGRESRGAVPADANQQTSGIAAARPYEDSEMEEMVAQAKQSNSGRANASMAESREVMNIRQASQYLGVSPDTLYKYVYEEKIPAFKLGNRWKFKKSKLDEWMEEKSTMRETGEKKKPKAARAAGQ
jgi:excisionase family DNA binding protein